VTRNGNAVTCHGLPGLDPESVVPARLRPASGQDRRLWKGL